MAASSARLLVRGPGLGLDFGLASAGCASSVAAASVVSGASTVSAVGLGRLGRSVGPWIDDDRLLGEGVLDLRVHVVRGHGVGSGSRTRRSTSRPRAAARAGSAAIAAKRVASSSAIRRWKNSAISASKASTRRWTRSMRPSMSAAWASISRSRRALRWVMRSSVSSRIRAISALDHSRMDATSSSACLRSSVASTAVAAWIDSMWALASALKRASVSALAVSAAPCMARVRSTMNLLGCCRVAFEASVASAGDGSAASVGSTGALSSIVVSTAGPSSTAAAWSVSEGAASIMSGASISWSVGRAAPTGASPVVSARASDSFRSALHGRRKPGLASVVAMRWGPLSGLGVWGCIWACRHSASGVWSGGVR